MFGVRLVAGLMDCALESDCASSGSDTDESQVQANSPTNTISTRVQLWRKLHQRSYGELVEADGSPPLTISAHKDCRSQQDKRKEEVLNTCLNNPSCRSAGGKLGTSVCQGQSWAAETSKTGTDVGGVRCRGVRPELPLHRWERFDTRIHVGLKLQDCSLESCGFTKMPPTEI